jgi:hypothetical protein
MFVSGFNFQRFIEYSDFHVIIGLFLQLGLLEENEILILDDLVREDQIAILRKQAGVGITKH